MIFCTRLRCRRKAAAIHQQLASSIALLTTMKTVKGSTKCNTAATGINLWKTNLNLTRSLREPGGPCTKSMEVPESRMERVKTNLLV